MGNTENIEHEPYKVLVPPDWTKNEGGHEFGMPP